MAEKSAEPASEFGAINGVLQIGVCPLKQGFRHTGRVPFADYNDGRRCQPSDDGQEVHPFHRFRTVRKDDHIGMVPQNLLHRFTAVVCLKNPMVLFSSPRHQFEHSITYGYEYDCHSGIKV